MSSVLPQELFNSILDKLAEPPLGIDDYKTSKDALSKACGCPSCPRLPGWSASRASFGHTGASCGSRGRRRRESFRAGFLERERASVRPSVQRDSSSSPRACASCSSCRKLAFPSCSRRSSLAQLVERTKVSGSLNPSGSRATSPARGGSLCLKGRLRYDLSRERDEEALNDKRTLHCTTSGPSHPLAHSERRLLEALGDLLDVELARVLDEFARDAADDEVRALVVAPDDADGAPAHSLDTAH